MKTHTLLPLCLCVFVVLLPGPTAAQVGFRQVTSTHPAAVQRGTTAEIRLRSNYTLDDAHAVFFNRPGITMRLAETEPIEAPRQGRGSVGTPFRFSVTVPEEQLPGVYEYRVATPQAVSSAAQLLVTDYPVVAEADSENGTPAAAQQVAWPAAVCGTCEPAEDVDCYRIHAEAGQELTFEIYAQRVTDRLHNMVVAGPSIYLMDPIVTLYGPNGQVVAQNDNFFGGDSFLHAVLPMAGDYVLEVRDARYAGNARYTYCLEISDRPYAHAVFPPAVQAGESAEVEVIGHMLGGTARATVAAPAIDALPVPPNAEMRAIDVRLDTARGPTNPVPLLVSPYPQFVETEGNNAIAEANPITLPAGVNGRLAEPDDIDYYAFTAAAGQVFRFEVESQRDHFASLSGSRLPLDSVIEVYNAQGAKLAENDDYTQTKDSRLFWTAPSEGTFYVAVRDLHGRGGERYVYHLRAEPSGPDFEVHGEYYYAFLAPGTRMIWFARIERLNGFDQPVAIEVEGLPPGVTQVPVTIPAGMTHSAIILEAAPDAPIAASLVRVRGRAALASSPPSEGGDGGGSDRAADAPTPQPAPTELVRYGRVTCEQQGSGGGQARWEIDTQIVGVTGPLDLTAVVATPEEITLRPGERAEIAVRVTRREGFTEPVTLEMAFTYFETAMGQQLPPGVTVSPQSQTRLAGDTLEGRIILEASPGTGETPVPLPVERLPIAVVARVPITFSITTNYASTPVYLTVAQPP